MPSLDGAAPPGHFSIQDRPSPELNLLHGTGCRVMVRLSKLTDYGVVVLMRLSAGQKVQTSPCIAVATGIPEPTVAKVLKMLSAAQLAASSRGARGGYRLGRPLPEISVADVIAAIDGPIALTACVEGAPSVCDISMACAMRGRWEVVNDAIRQALSGISLAELRPEPSTHRLDVPVDAAAIPVEP